MVKSAVGASTVLLACGVAAAGAPPSDPPRIVQWHLIGGAGLRMTRADVEKVYGRPSYPGLGSESPQYRVRGGVLFIAYGPPCNSLGQCRGRVTDVSTNSRRYRTNTRFGVGSRIPFAKCKRRPDYTQTWHGYRLGRHPETGVPVWWKWATYRGRPITAFVDVRGAGLAPYRPVGIGVVFQLGFIDGRVKPSSWRPTLIPDNC